MPYQMGQTVRLPVQVTDPSSGAATDPTTLQLTVRLPDGSTDGPFTPARDGAGQYHYDYLPTTAGHFQYRAVSTGTASGVVEAAFDVVAPWAVTELVSLDDVKTHLNMTTDDNDDELAGFVAAATAVVELPNNGGAVVHRPASDLFDEQTAQLVLSGWPVLSVDLVSLLDTDGTVLSSGTPDSQGYSLNRLTGTLVRRSALVSAYDQVTDPSALYVAGQRGVQVDYTVGRMQVPADLRLGTLNLVKWLWDNSQRNSGGRRGSVVGSQPMMPGYGLPNFVGDMVKPHGRGSSVVL